MRIFVSYASENRDVAERIAISLRGSGHRVFLDKDDLPPGRTYEDQIRIAVMRSDLFLFLISPSSISHGRYTLSELNVARRRWPNPEGRVLPVMVERPSGDLPAYLSAVTILTPEGNLVADVVAEVEHLRGKKGRRRIAAWVIGAALLIAAGSAGFWSLAHYFETKVVSPINSAALNTAGGPRFQIGGGLNAIGVGSSDTMQLVNQTPALLPEYRCSISYPENPNVASVVGDERCGEVKVTAVRRGFVSESGAPLDQYAVFSFPIEFAVLDATGKVIWRERRDLTFQNAFQQLAIVRGESDETQGWGELRIVDAAHELQAPFVCRVINSQGGHIALTEVRNCVYRAEMIRSPQLEALVAREGEANLELIFGVSDGRVDLGQVRETISVSR